MVKFTIGDAISFLFLLFHRRIITNSGQFQKEFGTEESCAIYLAHKRWKDAKPSDCGDAHAQDEASALTDASILTSSLIDYLMHVPQLLLNRSPEVCAYSEQMFVYCKYQQLSFLQ
ncbi:hypothetical protein, partial [Paenibacillus cisolokensis]|uniref:hypothetical protein n=1 Tax=Paenibacillus cisolokensis TaxID=1658519 RepID=UPI001BCD6D45